MPVFIYSREVGIFPTGPVNAGGAAATLARDYQKAGSMVAVNMH